MTLSSLMRWAGAPAHADEPLEARRSRNVVSGTFLGLGVILVVIAFFAIPGLTLAHRPTLIVIACVMALGALGQVATAASVPVAMNHLTTVLSAVALAVVQILVGNPVAFAAVGLLYAWIALIAAMYYSPRATVAHVSGLVAVQVGVGWWVHDATLAPIVVLTAGSSVVVAALITLLMQHVRQQMMTDPLTGLVNRRGMAQQFITTIAATAREGQPLYIVALDLDRFKELNDTHGHAAGDRTLIDAADAWRRAIRPGDALARMGGDEFMALLPGCSDTMARAVVERMLGAVPAGVECSAGATRCTPTDSLASAGERADAALYRAKEYAGSVMVMHGDAAPGALRHTEPQ